MPEHRLPEGRAFIDWLMELGKGFRYRGEPEWEIPDPEGTVYVDVAWLRSPCDTMPLFLFEVESRPTQGLAENAAKVLTVPTANAPKPLFFFHVVLAGQGSRPGRAARAYAAHNYAVYRLQKAGETDRLLAEVIRQHARVSDGADPAALWRSLTAPSAPPLSLPAFFDLATATLPRAPWTRDLAAVALSDPASRPILAERLVTCLEHGEPPGSRYGTYWGDTWGIPLHLGILGRLRPDLAPSCLEALRSWQGSAEAGMTMIGPHFGLDRDYDAFVLNQAPMLWVLLAVLLDDAPGAAVWIGHQLAAVLARNDLSRAGLAGSAIWGLHLAFARDVPALWDTAAAALNDRGGVGDRALLHPPLEAVMPDDGELWAELDRYVGDGAVPVTRERVDGMATLPPTQQLSPVDFALRLLVLDLPGECADEALLTMLHKG